MVESPGGIPWWDQWTRAHLVAQPGSTPRAGHSTAWLNARAPIIGTMGPMGGSIGKWGCPAGWFREIPRKMDATRH